MQARDKLKSQQDDSDHDEESAVEQMEVKTLPIAEEENTDSS